MKTKFYLLFLLSFLFGGMQPGLLQAQTITVTDPSAGVYWQRGKTKTIIWTKEEFTNKVRIELWPEGGDTLDPVYGLIINKVGGLSYAWPIPAGLATGSYVIKVYAWGQTPEWSVVGVSAPFTVADINVLAPVTNAHWKNGTRHKVKWEQSFSGQVDIDLYSSDNSIHYSVANGVTGDSYTWLIPNASTLPSGSYNLKIWRSPAHDVVDVSTFYIGAAGDPYITTLTPAGGETWQRGTNKVITWEDNLNSNVKIQLCNAAGTVLSTIKISASDNSYNWPIPSNLATGTYKLKLSNVNNDALYDYSGLFTVCASIPGGTVTINKPVAGVNWNRGALHTITWTKGGGLTDNVKIDLINADGDTLNLKPSTAASSLDWYIPYTKPAGTYTIKVSSVQDDHIFDTNYFHITLSAGGKIQLLKPVAGVDWNRGATHTIKWKKTSCTDNVKIDLINADGDTLNLKPSTAASSLDWYIPYSQLPGTYTIKVSSVQDDHIFDTNYFHITLSAGSFIAVTAPNGGEIWGVNQTHVIKWTKNFTENVKIELYNESGTLDKELKKSVSGNSCSWYIREDQSVGNYKIKISSVLDSTLADVSDATFAIAQFKYQVYPNPGGPVLNVKLDNYGIGIYTVELYNRFGTMVKKATIDTESQSECTLTTSDLPGDIYLMVVTSGETRLTKKVLLRN